MQFNDQSLTEESLFHLYKSKGYNDTRIALELALEKINTKILKIGDTPTRKQLLETKQLIQDEISASYGGLFEQMKEESLQSAMAVNAPYLLEFTSAALPTATIDYLTNSKREILGYEFKDLFKLTEDNHIRQLKVTLASGVSQGMATNQLIKELGIKNEALTKHQLFSAVHTTIKDAREVSTYATYAKLEEMGVAIGYQSIATMDGRTSEICRNLDNKKYFMKIQDVPNKPPRHFRCLTGDTLVSTRYPIAYISKRLYQGTIYTIKTAAGNSIRCTPNHPILTDRGFIEAQFINKFDKIATDLVGKGLRVFNNQNDKGISTIEEMFSSARESFGMSPVTMPLSTEDFHGDVMPNEKVDIVFIDRELWFKSKSSFNKISLNNIFIMASSPSSSISNINKSAMFLWDSLSRLMCALNLKFLLLFSHKRPLHRFLFGLISKLNSLTLKFRSKLPYANIKSFTDSCKSDSVFIERNSTFENKNSISPEMKIKRKSTIINNNSYDNFMSDTELFTNISSGSMGDKVFFDNIVNIDFVENFSTHVYNLENDLGYYTANNLITHNCRSKLTPITSNDYKSGKRASIDGEIPNMSYGKWFATKNDDFQLKTLGRTKYDAYKKGLYQVNDVSCLKPKNSLSLEEIQNSL